MDIFVVVVIILNLLKTSNLNICIWKYNIEIKQIGSREIRETKQQKKKTKNNEESHILLRFGEEMNNCSV